MFLSSLVQEGLEKRVDTCLIYSLLIKPRKAACVFYKQIFLNINLAIFC
jgi:hypothetical protein